MTEIQAFPLQWPLGWERSKFTKRARFKDNKTIYSSVSSLRGELIKLCAINLIVSTNIPVKQDGTPYSSYKIPTDKGVAIYFTLNKNPHVLACDKWDKVEHNIYAVAMHIEALRGQSRWGVGTIEQAFTGFKALSASGSNWWEILGISEYSCESEIVSAYKLKSKVAHPDVGGSNEQMAILNNAKEQALQSIKQ